MDGMDIMAGVQLDEYGMLAPPPPPTPPYAMSESSAESDSSLTELLRHSQATRDSIEGPYDEGELLNFEYPHRAQDAERLPMEGDVKRPARETRREIELKIRRHEEERARREKGVNRNLFMIRRTDMYRMYRPKMENLPKSVLVLPPPLAGQKDSRARRCYSYNRFRELPPLKGPETEKKRAPPPPVASEASRRMPPGGMRPREDAAPIRPATPAEWTSVGVSVVDAASADELRRREQARASRARGQAERDRAAAEMAAKASGIGEFGLQPDFRRLATLHDFAKRCKASEEQTAEDIDAALDMPLAALGIEADMHRPWQGLWNRG